MLPSALLTRTCRAVRWPGLQHRAATTLTEGALGHRRPWAAYSCRLEAPGGLCRAAGTSTGEVDTQPREPSEALSLPRRANSGEAMWSSRMLKAEEGAPLSCVCARSQQTMVPWATFSPPPTFVNKVLQENSFIHLHIIDSCLTLHLQS